MIPSTRAELEQRILQDLGEPVIKVNLAPIQLENAVDDAIAYWSEFHVDAQERSLIKIQITEQDIENKYVQLPSQIQAVYKVYNPRAFGAGVSWMSAQFEMIRDTVMSAASTQNLSAYVISRMYMEEIQHNLAPSPQFDFRYLRGRCYIFEDWNLLYKPGDWLLMDVQGFLYGSAPTAIYKDKTLRKLAAAYAKKSWGQNLKKFSGVTLPSGTTLNGDAIYSDALDEIKEWEDYIGEMGQPLGLIIA
jgi:hypothetical protein